MSSFNPFQKKLEEEVKSILHKHGYNSVTDYYINDVIKHLRLLEDLEKEINGKYLVPQKNRKNARDYLLKIYDYGIKIKTMTSPISVVDTTVVQARSFRTNTKEEDCFWSLIAEINSTIWLFDLYEELEDQKIIRMFLPFIPPNLPSVS